MAWCASCSFDLRYPRLATRIISDPARSRLRNAALTHSLARSRSRVTYLLERRSEIETRHNTRMACSSAHDMPTTSTTSVQTPYKSHAATGASSASTSALTKAKFAR